MASHESFCKNLVDYFRQAALVYCLLMLLVIMFSVNLTNYLLYHIQVYCVYLCYYSL
ncbi:hypothetical protein CWATWH0401_3360 [Crocosphaera watsonii WH 0401]|uniref:Uncharacterized protein n=1 Tax=Crocosphaera watsonii WH 0401 TaxID=555881 RepID=T2JBU7_CROWT|nr:hypothetical protein CWATWH0401_3360 [Crocosphaera watsonii WH 0401]